MKICIEAEIITILHRRNSQHMIFLYVDNIFLHKVISPKLEYVQSTYSLQSYTICLDGLDLGPGASCWGGGGARWCSS